MSCLVIVVVISTLLSFLCRNRSAALTMCAKSAPGGPVLSDAAHNTSAGPTSPLAKLVYFFSRIQRFLMKSSPRRFYDFGPFRLDTSAPLLWRSGEPVDLPLKALETLAVLVKEAGQLVRRADLIEAVWPETVIEDNNLSVNISLLRKVLGEHNGAKYIETVSRRGYRFIAQVRNEPHASARTLPIAVLPFKQNTAEENNDYLGIGLCDTLITRLSNVSRFAVRPTSTVGRYPEDRFEPLAAGRELKVDYVVDGRIRRAGEVLRVNVQLLRTSEEAICWAGQFDEKLTDVLQLEDSIAEQVALALIPQMTAAERERLARRGTDNLEAVEAYLRGRFHFNSLTQDGFAKARAAYESAVKLDPSYALAYTGIADYYYFLAVWGVMPSDQCLAACEAAARRAVEIDPNL